MKRRQFCLLGWLTVVGLALSPFLLWVLIVLVAPTSWARRHVVAALEKRSGRKVELDGLSVCLAGNIELCGLRVAAPGRSDKPWLDARSVRLNVSLFQLLCGKFNPTYLEVDDATLRVLRKSDGTLEIAETTRKTPGPISRAIRDPEAAGPACLDARLRGLRLEVIDEPDGTALSLQDVAGEGTWVRDSGLSTNLFGHWNGGTFQLSAKLDSSENTPSFEGELRANDVILDERMNLLAYAVPVLAGKEAQVQGRMAVDLYLRGRGSSGPEIAASLVGHGHAAIDPVDLEGTPFMVELGKLLKGRIAEKTGSLRTDFIVQSNRVTTERMELSVGKLPVLISGWTDFSGSLDYLVKLDGVADRLPTRARRLIQRLDVDLEELATIRLTGDMNQVRVSLNTADGSATPIPEAVGPEDRERLRMLGRQIREKVLR
ncbi:AsmA-like C-terminal region-containing protein [Aquisphaera insulae]|uniref:AsmA-like C-terminal region-containing protein n=1 Tax=Aquisphaera insulae TaxID=2712864 RepID=UPI0013EBCE1A|nr:AsmA-like C-terminal region-containing protein [Aquisphaera insulae]